MASHQQAQATAAGDLVDLVSASGQTTVYPSDDALLAVLQQRFRADLPYTRVGPTVLVALNPYKTLASVNDASAQEYETRCYRDTSVQLADSPRPLQPHVYELAATLYLLVRRQQQSQAVVARGITGSGKSSTLRLLVNQLLRLSAHSKKEARLADQLKAVHTVLDSFGNAKTLPNPNASRHARYLELHFSDRGRFSGAKILTYGLDKSRLNRLSHEERTFHVFYQLLAGSTPQERDSLNLEDPSDYALLASSGCYRLPSGPFSDDSIAMAELRAAMRTLGFKPKHIASIFSLLIAILQLGNIQFIEADHRDVSAQIANAHVLDHAARLLGLSSDDLAQVLTNRTSYVKKELYTVLLNKDQAERQRDQCVRDLYAILFAFVVETCNHRLAPSASHTQIVLFDQAGFQTRAPTGTASFSYPSSHPQPLIASLNQNGLDEFLINFSDELVHSFVLRHTFENTVGFASNLIMDGVSLSTISTMDNGACVELLRGAGLAEQASRKPTAGVIALMHKAASNYKSGKTAADDETLVQELDAKYGVHASYTASSEKGMFSINHYAGSVTYDASPRGAKACFTERNADLVDAAFVNVLRQSGDVFVAKLVSGPSLAAERHVKDENMIVQAQVSSRPLRFPSATASTPDEHTKLDPNKTFPLTTQLNYTLSEITHALGRIADQTPLFQVVAIRPNDSSTPNSFDKRRVKAQIRSLLLPDLVARKSVTRFVVGVDKVEFCDKYVPTMQGEVEARVTQCVRANGWREGEDYVVGGGKVWLAFDAWKIVEDVVRAQEKAMGGGVGGYSEAGHGDEGDEDDGTEYTHTQQNHAGGSVDNLLAGSGAAAGGYAMGGLRTPSTPGMRGYGSANDPAVWDAEYDKEDDRDAGSMPSLGYQGGGGAPGGGAGSPNPNDPAGSGMIVRDAPNAVEEVPTSRSRRYWLYIVWATTFWMPSFLLRYLGRMKRPDVRLAWREKVTIFWLIFLFNACIIFYIVLFGRLLCPNFDKAWSAKEVSQHQGRSDFWVSIRGSVYDVSNFVWGDHSNGALIPSNTPDVLESLAGQDLTGYFPIPLTLGCQGLVNDPNVQLTLKNFTLTQPLAVHNSGTSGAANADLQNPNWYTEMFLPTMNKMFKGPLVFDRKEVAVAAEDAFNPRNWAFYHDTLYDLTDYINSLNLASNNPVYAYLADPIVSLFRNRAGQDISKELDSALAGLDSFTRDANMACLNNVFKVGGFDFRTTAKCQVQNYLLITFTGILMASMLLKFLAALQLGPKRTPELQDKFVLCQVPCYTEGEDSLRRTIDSLAALNYDDKRKLIFIICDGNIIGSGNDRTTPRIVLDILGVDPKFDPEPLLFKSVGEGSKALNYGKVYSGLYEFEGHVVPYMVVVKVGKPTERSKPGNRGKRDSQILLMHYLNRVHFDLPMSPLELEIYHQMRNVIGIDPAFYEYIFTVDADTTVTPDSLNRLVASSADDSRIIGICGETKLTNEEGSWWTMIQVYEYYISHHLSKAFESLFGSVTCLPGCFSLYRIRTADKGRPIIISNRIIEEYAEPNVDTLHKKNLFSLGEDRFLTTLLMKHFPTFKTKFCPDAIAHTMAPESWRVLFSQRRRWINSTVHNLCELVILPELFGFCCFSMRFFVFIDLLGTIMLPATVVYLVYLIIVVALKAAAFPQIAIIMLGVTYGLQAIIFIIKREFMLVGWMVVYLLSYPVYSFFLPVYSFWCMDEFSWGNTRVVVGEGKEKKVLMNEEEKFDESMIPLKKFSEYEAEAWETGSRHSDETGYDSKPRSRSHGNRSREESPHAYNPASQSGDYYRDTNVTFNNSSNPNLRLGVGPGSAHSHSSRSYQPHGPGTAPTMSQYGGAMPFNPFMGPGGGPPSITGGSDYGGQVPMMMPSPMYGMMGTPAGVPRNTMMSGFGPMFGTGGLGMGGLGGGSPAGSQVNATPPSAMPTNLGGGVGQRPMSTFSMATSVNPFAGPSMNPNPTDDELFSALRNYLSTQDLMTVTKKTAREAIASRFPKADLAPRKDFLNQSIDRILSES